MSSRQEKKRARTYANRRKRRARDEDVKAGEEVNDGLNFTAPKRVCFKRVKESLDLKVELDEEKIPVAATGWVGKAVHPDGKIYGLEELLGPKFQMRYVDASR